MLFVVRHHHALETCPAADPDTGAWLLSYLSATNAARYGVTIHAEALTELHTLTLILEAADQTQVGRFMAPLGAQGTIEVVPAFSCEAAVARGGCSVTEIEVAGREGQA